ncbi:Crp/Fnr family transcriptional regulator [Pedobacter panaciterrae]|jgi:cAMP-binding proteins - catabolite gene activator and regulatory subunit of cAMP-dependent protein kinases|uniref:Crp/Fnr family transcriptional regulator n=1 Tax=Pedobacter panaciterrae TaxID=363849 RepID=A0ABU8NSV7_9SPHI|nr:Crp/Fnr family transcriptional regulator [Pedobacter panaciterrae]NQX54576.1 Crp/Fnr family transcriptional regulator [Pedobacter panaciterrae]
MGFDLILQNITKYIPLDRTEADFFVSLLQSKTLKKRDYLLRQGDICKTENFIIKGCFRVYSIDENGVEHIVMFGIESWWISDLYSFLTQAPADYFIEALEDSEILQITRENLERLYEKVPKFERFFRIILQNAFITQQNRIKQNLSSSAEERYLYFIERYPQMAQRVSQKQVAAYLGITPVFLSMLRRKLVKKGNFIKLV